MQQNQLFEIRRLECGPHPDRHPAATASPSTATAGPHPSTPHQHRQFELIYLTAGNSICRIDLEEFPLSAQEICFIRPGKMHSIEPGPDAKGFVLSFDPDFFHMSPGNPFLLNPAFSHGTPLQVPGDLRIEMNALAKSMDREYTEGGLFRTELLCGLLKIFLLYLSRLSPVLPPTLRNRRNKILEQFLTILEEKYITHRRPADYADALFLSTSYLNETIKTISGYTTSHHIHQRILQEAKRLAIYSDNSLKEVASILGFDDVCHFSRFFKKACGRNFKEFKATASHFSLAV